MLSVRQPSPFLLVNYEANASVTSVAALVVKGVATCVECKATFSLPGLHNKHWPAGPPAFFSRRASDTQLLLARTGHKVFVRDTHCHILLARTIIQRADLFPHCRDHFVRNATRLTHRSEFPCYVADIQPLTVYPTIPLVLK